MQRRFTRRGFMRSAAMAGSAALLAACQPKVVEKVVEVTKVVTQKEVVKETVIVAGTPQVVEKVVEKVVTLAPTPRSQTKVTVNWLGPFVPPNRYEFLIKELLVWYKDIAPHVEIKAEQATSWADTEEKILVRFAAGSGPDLAQTYDAPLDFASRKMFAPLNPFLEKDDRIKPEMFYLSLLRGGQYEGQTFCLPHNAITQIFFYNKKHFETAGLKEPPTTHNEVAEFAKKLTSLPDVDFGLRVDLTDADTFSAYLYAAGGRFMSEDCTRTHFDDKTTINTLAWVVNMVKSGICFPHGSAADVTNGKVSMRTSVPWIVNWTKTNAPDIYDSLGASLVPGGAGGRTSYSWAHYESILSNSKVKEEAWNFLAWMMSDEKVDFEFHDKQGFLPTQPRTFAKPAFADHFAWKVFGQQLAAARSVPPCVKWKMLKTEALNPEVEAAWLGQKTPEDAMASATAKAARIL